MVLTVNCCFLTNECVDQQRLVRNEILDWLALPTHEAQHNDNLKKRQHGTGKWFLESPKFAAWAKEDNSTLFCPGIPGAGKTILASIAVEYLRSTSIGEDSHVAFVYCNYKMREEQTAETLLSALLRQLVEQSPSIPESVKILYYSHEARKTRPSLEHLSNTFCSVVQGQNRTYLVVDALDECSNATCTVLLSEFRKLQKKARVCFMATSRHSGILSQEFSNDRQLEIRANKEDVESYLHDQLGELSDCIKADPTLQGAITKGIAKVVDGM